MRAGVQVSLDLHARLLTRDLSVEPTTLCHLLSLRHLLLEPLKPHGTLMGTLLYPRQLVHRHARRCRLAPHLSGRGGGDGLGGARC